MLYFAYGSNMTAERLARCCPGARFVGPAIAADWAFGIGRSGYATMVPCPGGRVHGVLWRIRPQALAALDAYDEVERGLYGRAALTLADARRAFVYLACDARPGSPRPGHLEEIIAAARRWRFPEPYLRDEIGRWMGWNAAGRLGCAKDRRHSASADNRGRPALILSRGAAPRRSRPLGIIR